MRTFQPSEYPVNEIEDGLRRSIALVELLPMDIRDILIQGVEYGGTTAAPPVDRLLGVADEECRGPLALGMGI